MKIRKYRAPTMREALAEAKKELGPDALILATRELRRGVLGSEVEVTAAIDDGSDAAVEPATLPAQSYGPSSYGPSKGGPSFTSAAGAAATQAVQAQGLAEIDVERIIAPLRAELRSLRSMMRPMAEVGHELSSLRESLARPPVAEPVSLESLAGRTITAPTQRRVIVLVGPTGVGKTTTLAKLAARDALVDRRRVALISLDDYRIGGAEQIRTYADLIGVPVELVSEPGRLRATVDRLRDAERIYVDTAGRSPRDRESMWALERALGGVGDVEVHLAIAAGTPAAQFDLMVRRHRALNPSRLLFTKLDEAADLGELVRAPARLDLPVTWITTGQRVPEDFETATADRLADLASGAAHIGEEEAA
jgi:flagellar biosynthesis protein FlhF